MWEKLIFFVPRKLSEVGICCYMAASEKNVPGERALFRNLLALGLVSFFADISSEMVFSLLPTFILELSGSGAAVLGLIEEVAEDLSYTLRAISGLISDKIRRKIIILIGYAFSNVVKPFFAIAQSVIDVLVIKVSAIAYMFSKKYFEGLNFEVIDGEEEILEGIKVFPTPEHSPCGQSVEVNTALGKLVIAGFCCIRENFQPPEKIRGIFRFILPGFT